MSAAGQKPSGQVPDQIVDRVVAFLNGLEVDDHDAA